MPLCGITYSCFQYVISTLLPTVCRHCAMSPIINADDIPSRHSPVTDSLLEGSASPALRVCCFRFDPISSTGKRVYLLQMIILPFIPIAALIVQNCCTMVSVTIANRDAMEINKQVNAGWHRPIVLIIRPNTTYRSSSIVFYYTLQHVSALRISHHQVDVEYIERYIQGVPGEMWNTSGECSLC